MIQINFETNDGDFFETGVASVPRIGETVKLGGSWYIVTDVRHTIGDRYTKASITVFVRTNQND